ncbi:MAG: hypothetical protein WBD86_02135 [Microgenomates group bacterium]
MVENKVALLIKEVEQARGRVNLFILIYSSVVEGSWEVIISSEWLNRVSEKEAISFWVKKLKSKLEESEIRKIVRITVLKTTNPFVREFTSNYLQTNHFKHIENISIANMKIKRALLFRSYKEAENITPPTRSRNPKYNANLNPRYNASINPKYNANLNPRYNATLNIRYNASLDPRYNASLDPRYNPSINPARRNFSGWFLYDLSLNKTSYAIKASDEVIFVYNLRGNKEMYGVKNDKGYSLFDKNSVWVGYLIETENVFLQYDLSNKWIGLMV